MATSAAMDLSQSPATDDTAPASDVSRQRKKKAKRTRRARETDDYPEAWATRYQAPNGRAWVYYTARLPFNQTCLQFVQNSPGPVPEKAAAQLLKLVRTCTDYVHIQLTGKNDFVFVANLDQDKQEQLDKIVSAAKITITGTSFSYSAEVRKLRALLRDHLLSHGLVTDGLTTSGESSADEDTPAATRKQSTPMLTQPAASASLTIVPPEPLQTATAETSQPTGPPQPPPAEPAQPMDQATTDPSAQQPEPRPRAQGRRRNIFRSVDFSTLEVPVPATTPCLTVLFKTANKGDDLSRANPAKLTEALMKYGHYTGLRDIREGGLAIDFPLDADAASILAINSLAGIAVTASLPATATESCHAVLSGVHPELTTDEILQNITTSPPAEVIAARRLAKPGQVSWSVKLTFRGVVRPERAMLYSRSRKLSTYTDRPLQCHRCGRYGHAERVCRSKQRCFTCSQLHATADCPANEPARCGNCGGPHAVNSTDCAARAFQKKVCEVRAERQVPYKTARIAVSKAAKSYSAALKGPQAATKPGFVPNVAHPRPPQPASPADFTAVLTLFKGLLTILAKTVPCGSYGAVVEDVTSLFRTLAPGANFTA